MTLPLVLCHLASAWALLTCSADDARILREARGAILRGDTVSENALAPASPECGEALLARLAWRGWLQARDLAPKGGPVEQLGPVRETLAELAAARHAHPALALEVEYVEVTVRAAVAAAQDERPEMELLLTHARDLTERLQYRGRSAQWPLPFNLAAGELWFEVDRYRDAVDAYERANSAEISARALLGAARGLARLGRHEEACTRAARARDVAPALRKAAAADLSRCRR